MDEELNKENIANLNQSLQDLQRLMQQQTGLMRQQNQLSFLQLNASERAKIKLDEFGQTIAEDDKIVQAHIKQIELTNQRMAALRGAFDNVTLGAKSLFNALTEASGGVVKYKGVLDSVGGVFDNLIKGFGPQSQILNNGLQYTAKALVGLGGLVLDQTQYMIKSMDTVAGLGVTSGISANQLRLLGENAGYSYTNLEKFAAITAKAGRDLRAMGGSSSAGIVAFTRFVSIGDEQYKKYRALGIEQDAVTEMMRELASIQIRSGQATGRGAGAMDRLQSSTLKLIDNMLALADITGISVDEQKKGLEFAAQNRNFQLFAARESIRAAQLRKTNTPEANREADLLEAKASSKRQIAGLIRQEFGEEIATGFLQRAAGTKTGALTEQSVPLELLLREQGGAAKFIDAINNAISPEEAQKATLNLRAAILTATQRQIELGKSFEGLGQAEIDFQETFGVFGAGVETVVRNLDPEKIRQSVEQAGTGFTDAFNSSMEKLSRLTNAQGEFVGKANDNIMNAAASIAAFERYATLQLATIIASMNPLIGNATSAAAKLIAVSVAAGAAAAALTAFAYKLLRTPTSPAPVPGSPTGTGGPGKPGGKVEKRTDKRGRDYYVDTATGKRVSKETGEAASRKLKLKPGALLRGGGGIATSLLAPYAVDAVGGESSTAGALTNILAQTSGMAMTGGAVGSAFAGVGALPGAIIGGALGLGTGLYQSGGVLLDNLFGKKTSAVDVDEQSQDQHKENLEQMERELGIGETQIEEMQKSVDLAYQQLRELVKIGDGINDLTQKMQEGSTEDMAQKFIDEGGQIFKDKVIDPAGNTVWSATDAFLKRQSTMMGTAQRYYTESEKRQQYQRERAGSTPQLNRLADASTQTFEQYTKNFDKGARPTRSFDVGTDSGGGTMGAVPVLPTSPGLNFNARGEFDNSARLSTGGTSSSSGPGQVDLTNVTSKNGASASVNKKFQNQFQGLIDDLEKTGYKITRIDGYNRRKVAGTNQWSSHAYGAAIDINPTKNMPGQAGDLPVNAAAIAAKYGLGWGGNFRNNPDPMHFSARHNEGGSFQARYGAMLEGPMSGYQSNMTYHGTEIISPAPRDSILQKYFTETATSENKPVVAADIGALVNTQNNTFRELLRVQRENFGKQQLLVEKLETISDTLKSSQQTQTDILRYTRS